MSFALLFSGQGTQHADMLPWLADDEYVLAMRAQLGIDDWRSHLANPVWAMNNCNAQLLLTHLSLAAWSQLAPLVPPPAVVAGYSVGELPAFSAAGAIAPADAARLAPLRAAAMDRCAAHSRGGLLAVSGLSRPRVDGLCDELGLETAIRNGVDSVVLGGLDDALVRAEARALAEGAQCTRLRISIASHTSWMRSAAESFANSLEAISFQAPRTALFSNAADRIRDASAARSALAAQIATTVRWDECMENVMARQVACVLEIGPGQALARMWNQRYPSVPARACDDFRSVEAIATWLDRHVE